MRRIGLQITAASMGLIQAAAQYTAGPLYRSGLALTRFEKFLARRGSCHRVSGPATVGSFRLMKTSDGDRDRDLYSTEDGTQVEVLIVRCDPKTAETVRGTQLPDRVAHLKQELQRLKRDGQFDYSPFFDAADSVAIHSKKVAGRQLGFAIRTADNMRVMLIYIFAADGLSVTVQGLVPIKGWETHGVHGFARELVRLALEGNSRGP